jgi:hypothetical protein
MVTEQFWLRRDRVQWVEEATRLFQPMPEHRAHTIVNRRLSIQRSFPGEVLLELDGLSQLEMADRAMRQAEYDEYCRQARDRP